MRGVANCVIQNNRVVKEWVSYNELSLIRQLGIDPREILDPFARERISNSQSVGGDLDRPFGEVGNVIAQGTPPPPPEPSEVVAGFDVEHFVRLAYHEI